MNTALRLPPSRKGKLRGGERRGSETPLWIPAHPLRPASGQKLSRAFTRRSALHIDVEGVARDWASRW